MSEDDGYWVALDPPPSPEVLGNPDELVRVVGNAAPRAFKRLGYRLRNDETLRSAECWLGITFMEEGPTRGETRRNWVFTRISRERNGRQRSGPLLRAQALTLAERRRRTPELVGLEHAGVLVIGAGSLGSPVAVELAKAGIGHVAVVDYDALEVNNSVRHVLSPRRAGLQKAHGTASVAADLNPFVAVEGHELQVGGDRYAAREVAALVEQATVVVETTGSSTVTRILQRHCAHLGRTLVVAGLSAGSWGGEIAVFPPGAACFECLVLAQRDGDVPQPHAAPPAPGVTPVGCSHPAFPGAGFDATELAALTARAVVQATGASKYPALDYDWAVVNFRGSPRWQADGCPSTRSAHAATRPTARPPRDSLAGLPRSRPHRARSIAPSAPGNRRGTLRVRARRRARYRMRVWAGPACEAPAPPFRAPSSDDRCRDACRRGVQRGALWLHRQLAYASMRRGRPQRPRQPHGARPSRAGGPRPSAPAGADCRNTLPNPPSARSRGPVLAVATGPWRVGAGRAPYLRAH